MSTPTIDHSEIAESINSTVNYTMYAVFREARFAGSETPHVPTGSVESLEQNLAAIEGLTTRGWYNISGFRADADVLVWWHAPTPEALQTAYRTVAEWANGALLPVWSNVGVHRTAEFNRSHIPGFLAGEAPGDYICVYPFVRSRDWYLLPDEDRGRMLREHGAAARDYGDVVANTVAAFALGDYEWLLAFESDTLHRLVDLMRELRAVDARLHVIEETPFFTGPRASAEELLGRLS
ncbi:MAG: hydrogen peroxide-dependent heme synthase [Canibacter sp.]